MRLALSSHVSGMQRGRAREARAGGQAGMCVREAREREQMQPLLFPALFAMALPPERRSCSIASFFFANEIQYSQLCAKIQEKTGKGPTKQKKATAESQKKGKTVAFSRRRVECREPSGQQAKKKRARATCYLSVPFSKPQLGCPRAQTRSRWSSSEGEARNSPCSQTSSRAQHISKKIKNLVDAENETEKNSKRKEKNFSTMAFTRTAVLFAILAGAAAQVSQVVWTVVFKKERGRST